MVANSKTAPDYDLLEDAPRAPSDLTLALRELTRRPPALLGLVILIVAMAMAIAPGLFSPLDPVDQDLLRYMQPPGFVDDMGRTYWLGTDEQGRDILSRIVWGARISLIVGVATVLVSGVIGISVGIVAGYFGGWTDTIISRIIDTFLAVPFILLAISLVAILGPSLQNIILVIVLRTWIVYARVVRGEVLSLKEHEFVVGARATGCKTWRILVVYLISQRHINVDRHRHTLPRAHDHYRIRAVVSRPGRAAADADVGRYFGRGTQLPRHRLVDCAVSGLDAHAGGAVSQSARRLAARCLGPSHQAHDGLTGGGVQSHMTHLYPEDPHDLSAH